MKPEDVITAIEKWQIRLVPCMSGRRWGAIAWLNGVPFEVRRRPNVTLAVRDLLRRLEGKTPVDCGCPVPNEPAVFDDEDYE